MSRNKKEDRKYDGFKIDMSWCFGKCRNVISKELDNVITKLFNIKGTYLKTDAKYSKPYIIVAKCNKYTYTIFHVDAKDFEKDDNKYFVKGYSSFEDIPFVEITANKVFNAVSYDEIRYNIPHEAAIKKLNEQNTKKAECKINTNNNNNSSSNYDISKYCAYSASIHYNPFSSLEDGNVWR